MKRLKALLWDVDGTLADTEKDGHRVAFNTAFKQLKLDWVWDVALYGQLLKVTGGKERIRRYLDTFHKEWHRSSELNAFIAEVHAVKTQVFQKMLAQGEIPMRPGVIELIMDAADAGIRQAIVTTTTKDNVVALLQCHFGMDNNDLFEVIAAGDQVAAKKPAPDIYLWAMDELGLAADACLALEDSKNGLESALGAGIKAVLITVNGYTRHEDLTGAALVVDQLGTPETPCTLLAGEISPGKLIDIAYLRQLHDNQNRSSNPSQI